MCLLKNRCHSIQVTLVHPRIKFYQFSRLALVTCFESYFRQSACNNQNPSDWSKVQSANSLIASQLAKLKKSIALMLLP